MDSSYQNTAEFLAVVAGVTALAELGYRNITLRLVGDSMTSLAWGTRERFTGIICRRASIVYMLLSTKFNIRVADSMHIPGTDNILCDDLSRYAILRTELGLEPSQLCNCSPSSPINTLLTICDPTDTSEVSSEESFLEFWISIHSVLSVL